MGVGGQHHVLAALPPEKNPGTQQRLDGAHRRFGRFGIRQKPLNHGGIRTPDRPARSLAVSLKSPSTVWKITFRHKRKQ